MAFDLIIGKSSLVKDNPVIFGSIDYDEHVFLLRLAKHHPNWFLTRLSNIYENQCFGLEELSEAATIVDDLILAVDNEDDRKLLFKLNAAISMAIRTGFPLFGVPD